MDHEMDQEGDYQWRMVCDHRHAGPQHEYRRYTLEAAHDTLKHFRDATMPFTRKYCLPGRVEGRFVSQWEEYT